MVSCTRKEELEASACCAGVNVITLRRALVGLHVAGCNNDSSDRGREHILKRKIQEKVDYIYRLRRKNTMGAAK